jgi:nucleoside-diphosphate-sugar epimerase
MGSVDHIVVVGGSGFLGRAIALRALELGHSVTIVDRSIPDLAHSRLTTIQHDLTSMPTEIPLGLLVLAHGVSHPRPTRAWNLVFENVLPFVNLLAHTRKRKVVLLSSVEVYGSAEGSLTEQTVADLPWTVDRIDEWCKKVVRLAEAGGNSREAMFELCLEMASADATGRWTYALTKLAQERLLLQHAPETALTVLRLGNVFGTGQERILTTMIRRSLTEQRVSIRPMAHRSFISVERVASIALSDTPAGTYNVAGVPVSLTELADLVRTATGREVKVEVSDGPLMDSSGLVDSSKLDEAIKSRTEDAESSESYNNDITDFASRYDPHGKLASPLIALVQPARPQNPKELTERIYSTLSNGTVKYGNEWTNELEIALTRILRLPSDRRLWVTNSGTSALRLAVQAVLHGRGGGKRHVAVVPAFTFAATSEFLTQLGFETIVCDVNPGTWTIDEARLRVLLSKNAADLVVAVDALGNPANYAALKRVCDEFKVPLVADSAPALSASYNGIPIGS